MKAWWNFRYYHRESTA